MADSPWQRNRRRRFGSMKCPSAAEQGDGGGQRSGFRGVKCLCSLEMSGT